ncbi:hypothetical protein BC351_00615 [Paenibacillus ferrarius]|uniref:Uncharacterized protein n=1 Tax=Paenibacillus ferrarius TaxID=1469647 RepID=A0A1V4HSB4_9BACL|nr:hypothetical protein [Paenibacillus ferrarius]OPH61777.1 hypothetical protein BC351_00615 [Paenibacillus ferrarius]
MTVEKALETLEEYIINNKTDVLDEAYLTLMKGFNELQEKVKTLTEDKAKVEEELEERKAIMWNDPNFRGQLVQQLFNKQIK